jgi:hypothetical protein
MVGWLRRKSWRGTSDSRGQPGALVVGATAIRGIPSGPLLYRAYGALRIYEGTTMIQQLIIAGELRR